MRSQGALFGMVFVSALLLGSATYLGCGTNVASGDGTPTDPPDPPDPPEPPEPPEPPDGPPIGPPDFSWELEEPPEPADDEQIHAGFGNVQSNNQRTKAGQGTGRTLGPLSNPAPWQPQPGTFSAQLLEAHPERRAQIEPTFGAWRDAVWRDARFERISLGELETLWPDVETLWAQSREAFAFFLLCTYEHEGELEACAKLRDAYRGPVDEIDRRLEALLE